MTDRVAHLSHLARAAFVDRDAQHRRVALGAPPDKLHVSGARSAPFNHDASRESIDVVRVRHAQHLCFVHALHLQWSMLVTDWHGERARRGGAPPPRGWGADVRRNSTPVCGDAHALTVNFSKKNTGSQWGHQQKSRPAQTQPPRITNLSRKQGLFRSRTGAVRRNPAIFPHEKRRN